MKLPGALALAATLTACTNITTYSGPGPLNFKERKKERDLKAELQLADQAAAKTDYRGAAQHLRIAMIMAPNKVFIRERLAELLYAHASNDEAWTEYHYLLRGSRPKETPPSSATTPTSPKPEETKKKPPGQTT